MRICSRPLLACIPLIFSISTAEARFNDSSTCAEVSALTAKAIPGSPDVRNLILYIARVAEDAGLSPDRALAIVPLIGTRCDNHPEITVREMTIVTVKAFASLKGKLGEVSDHRKDKAKDLTLAISELLRDPEDTTNGVAIEHSEAGRYQHQIIVDYTGRAGDSVDAQILTTADVALRIGNLTLERGFTPPGQHLIIKMSLKESAVSFINTFSVRYEWRDVLRAARSNGDPAILAPKGRIERIWLEYWPEICTNTPPKELFEDGDGNAFMPEDVKNPRGRNLSCKRKS
ncbi:hypothetical protein [Rhodomicrobium lacus]|uniref:hypothetical protein n=1 Tax=Rhodomicrobium lacus TaxID=2498452 RepID=UPI000F8CE4CF|nr:hypothetical protein [Rhodomicrobium lacus]